MALSTYRICGRHLTVRKSVEREIGPVCLARLRRGKVALWHSSARVGRAVSLEEEARA
jgi:hypothetical protein